MKTDFCFLCNSLKPGGGNRVIYEICQQIHDASTYTYEILSIDHTDFDKKLKELAAKLNATICFDAIGGEMTGKILTQMPKNSTIYVYGALSLTPVLGDISLNDVLFKGKTVKGWFLKDYIE